MPRGNSSSLSRTAERFAAIKPLRVPPLSGYTLYDVNERAFYANESGTVEFLDFISFKEMGSFLI